MSELYVRAQVNVQAFVGRLAINGRKWTSNGLRCSKVKRKEDYTSIVIGQGLEAGNYQ